LIPGRGAGILPADECEATTIMLKNFSDSVRRLLGRRPASAGKVLKDHPEKGDAELPGVPPDATVLRNVSSPYGRIDQIVETANGPVFLLRRRPEAHAVAFQGQFLLVDGQSPGGDLIDETLRQSAWLRGIVSARLKRDIRVEPLVVFAAGEIASPRGGGPVAVAEMRGVRVTTAAQLPALFGQNPAAQPPRQTGMVERVGRYQPRFLK
jgi:hypothetical protein